MPLTVSDLHAETPVPATLKLTQGEVDVTWYPSRLSGKIMADVAALDHIKDLPGADGIRVLMSAASILCKLLVSWDVREDPDPETGEPGPVVALTVERLSEFGIGVVWGLVMAILEQGRVGEANGATSKQA